jgi:hypothetical protein
MSSRAGPPGPEARHPGWGPRCHRVSITEPTIDTYPTRTQTSSDYLRLACAALSAEELAEWMCSHVAPQGGGGMSLDNNAASHIREFRHLFAGHRRIVATIRVDLARVGFQPGIMSCIRCAWEGSKVKQPSAELYPEFKAWMDYVLCHVTTKTGANLLYIFELPDPARRIELWLYESGRKPRLAKTLPNPFKRPLSELLAGMPPENWEDEP